MGHWNARYAVPGLMPPNDTNNQMHIELHEDGSALLCVYCGVEGDVVNYTVDLGGPRCRRGLLKDPSYEFGPEPGHKALERDSKHWEQFMRMEEELPEGCMVLKRVVHGDWTIPVTERDCIDDADKRYWILELPKEAVPYGQSILELCINGRRIDYVLTRPRFSIHAKCKGKVLRKKNELTEGDEGTTI